MKKVVVLLMAISVIATLLFVAKKYLITDELNQAPKILASEEFPAGSASVSFKPSPSLMLPATNLSGEALQLFHAGKALANQPWVKAPTVTFARDGLGPIYNARTCLACHIKGGRGRMPDDNNSMLFSSFLRLSLPGFDAIKGVIAEPTYGDQLQSQSTALQHQLRHAFKEGDGQEYNGVKPEAYVYINWQTSEFIYPDGETVTLRKPEIDIRNLGYGPMHKDTVVAIRNAPPIHGMGLIELIAQADINKHIDEQDKNSDGISGRKNIVWDFDNQKPADGRFGLKANKANVRLQVAGALAGDMGLTNPVFSQESCTQAQVKCKNSVHGNDAHGFEIGPTQLKLLVDFNRALSVPKRRDFDNEKVIAGREIFYQIGCQNCHQASYTTQKSVEYPHLSQQKIWPYSDFLLHDMGAELADGRSDYLASGSEWRTPPLWAVGLSAAVNASDNFLHDGRAKTIEQAILWHGGEAEQVKQSFVRLDKTAREQLLKFVESL